MGRISYLEIEGVTPPRPVELSERGPPIREKRIISPIQTLEDLVGVTLRQVLNEEGVRLVFVLRDGRRCQLYHSQDCCESVQIEDICGDLNDLVGAPLTQAEEVSNEGAPRPEGFVESYTWTFYRFATRKGAVTVRWLGEGDGYYSESVDFQGC